ncbi:hypothetical protein B0H14DRAFT_3452404 [Mycena olivaceomarginata]|nr:hypothetical protein B0H14DRAFT_3452404 [Mycena olivaceomarginata]
MLRLFNAIFALAARLSRPRLTTPRTPLPAPGHGDESWFVNVCGLISRDSHQLYKLRISASETPAQHPIYWAPTFDDTVKYLPRCRGFETAFGFGTEDPAIYFVVDWDQCIYHDSCAAESAWRRQSLPSNAIFTTLSWDAAWARAQAWPSSFTVYPPSM